MSIYYARKTRKCACGRKFRSMPTWRPCIGGCRGKSEEKEVGEGKGCRPTPAKGCRYTYLHPCLTRSSCCCMQLRALQRCRVESHRPKGLHLPHTRHALSSSLGNHSTLLVPIKIAGTCGCTHRWRERRCGVGGQFRKR